jgi:LPS sulfotransferase NodH
MVQRAQDARAHMDPSRFIDVRYTDLMRDPIGEVRRIHRHLDLPLSDASVARMQVWRAHNQQHRHGRHRYAAEDFGLTRSSIAERLAGYRRTFELGD